MERRWKYNTGGAARGPRPVTGRRRVGINWGRQMGNQATQVRGRIGGFFSGKAARTFWISNQIGNHPGVLYGFIDSRGTTAFPFNPEARTSSSRQRPAATAASLRARRDRQGLPLPGRHGASNIGGGFAALPWGPGRFGSTTSTTQDINAPVYINAKPADADRDLHGAWTTAIAGSPPWQGRRLGARHQPSRLCRV